MLQMSDLRPNHHRTPVGVQAFDNFRCFIHVPVAGELGVSQLIVTS